MTYIYEPLSHSQFRVLVLQRDGPKEEINCRLEIHDFVHPPDYEALSYVWGPRDPQQYITCNGMRTAISPNLYDALHMLKTSNGIHFETLNTSRPDESRRKALFKRRQHSGQRSERLWFWERSKPSWQSFAHHSSEKEEISANTRVLWIDALCINQVDNDEKAIQVANMDQIYSKASHTVVWLGSDDACMPGTLEIMAIAIRNGAKGIVMTDAMPWDGTDRGVPIYTDIPDPRLAQNGLPLYPQWDAFRIFFENAWFTRMWVIQESALSHSVTVYIGKYAVSWEAIGIIAQWLTLLGDDSELYQIRGYVRSACVIYSLGNADKKRSIALGDVLPLTWDFEATQPVDLIFALLGMVVDDGIVIDYHNSLQVVYSQVANFLLHQQPDFEVLSWVNHGSDGPTKDFPSWVPRWHRRKRDKDDPDPLMLAFGGSPMNESYNAANSKPISLRDLPDNKSMSSLGFEIDVVFTVGAKIETFDIDDDFKQNNHIFTSKGIYEDLLQADTSYITGESGVLAVATALTAGLYKSPPDREANTDLLATASRFFTEFFKDPEKQYSLPQQHKTLELIRTKILRMDPTYSKHDTAMIRFLEEDTDAQEFYDAIVLACTQHCVFRTRSGYLGLGPVAMKEGDVVVVLYGGRVPFVLRRREMGHGFVFIGDCYLHGIMNGEALTMLAKGELREEWFDIF